MPSNSCTPKPNNLFFAAGKSSGICALNTFCARCCSLKRQCLQFISIFLSKFFNNYYPPKFFHLAKNDSLFISVGSKNLLMVNGNLTLNFCCTPLYLNDISSEGASEII